MVKIGKCICLPIFYYILAPNTGEKKENSVAVLLAIPIISGVVVLARKLF